MNARTNAHRVETPPEDSFLEPGYEPPAPKGKYFRPSKLPSGKRRVRWLAPPLKVWRGWIRGKDKDKPVVVRTLEEMPEKAEDVQHVWFGPLYDYEAHEVLCADINQASVIRKTTELAREPEWGSPLGYDVQIVKDTSKDKPSYDVLPCKPTPLSAEVRDAWQEVQAEGFDIQRMFTDGKPFVDNGNGNGRASRASAQPTGFEPDPVAEVQAARRAFFGKLSVLVMGGIYNESIKADSESGRFERRKLLRLAIGGDPDPATMTAEQWEEATAYLQQVADQHRPPGANPADDDIPF